MQDESQNHCIYSTELLCAMGLGIDLHRDINVDNLNCISLRPDLFSEGGGGRGPLILALSSIVFAE